MADLDIGRSAGTEVPPLSPVSLADTPATQPNARTDSPADHHSQHHPLSAGEGAGPSSGEGDPAPILCWYDDGAIAAAYITLHWGSIGWCRRHLTKVDDWPARMFEEAH